MIIVNKRFMSIRQSMMQHGRSQLDQLAAHQGDARFGFFIIPGIAHRHVAG